VTQGHVAVALVGKQDKRALVVVLDRVVAVIEEAERDDFLASVREGGQRLVEMAKVLGATVFDDDLLARPTEPCSEENPSPTVLPRGGLLPSEQDVPRPSCPASVYGVLGRTDQRFDAGEPGPVAILISWRLFGDQGD
jgi:hypothetical protein